MTDNNHKPANLHDVARRAGVSHQTVSRVINNNAYVSEQTRQKVLKAIEEIGYRPNKVARSLVMQQSSTIAVLTIGVQHFGLSRIVVSVEQAARAKGYNVQLASITTVSVESIQTAINDLSGLLLAGVVVISPLAGLQYDRIVDTYNHIPYVEVAGRQGTTRPSVVIDSELGSRLAMQHLIDLGHQHIAEISGPLGWLDARTRHDTWVATLTAGGLRPAMSVEGDWTALSGFRAANQLLANGAKFSALLAGNDNMALGAMRALRAHGLHIPEDVSIVGTDDFPDTAFYEPPLTTVRNDFDALGNVGIDYLIARMTNPETPIQQYVLQPELIVRASTSPLRP